MASVVAAPSPGGAAARVAAPAAAFGLALAVLAVLSAVHLTQGAASLTDLGDDQVRAVLFESRLPRLFAALLVGLAVGAAGSLLQSVARNPLAAPDTLAVNAGAYVSVVAVAAFGISLPLVFNGLVAFIGGLLASALVLAVSRGGAAGPTRLVLAGSAVALALNAFTSVLLMLFEQNTVGLFAWGSGSTIQTGTRQVAFAAPLVAAGFAVVWLLAHRLDVLALGDDSARVLGVDVVRTRVLAVLLAVLLSATAVTVTGPIGFVGLAGPVVARILARRIPGMSRHALLVPFAGVLGALVIVVADVILRLVVPAGLGVAVPTGIITSLAGAALLIHLARQLPGGGTPARSSFGTVRSRAVVTLVTTTLAVLLIAAVLGALLLGDRIVLLGDVANWITGAAGRQVTFVLDQRLPRTLAALLGGAALAVAGGLVQAVARNPLAEPGLLGVTPGASLGAVAVVVLLPGVGIWPVTGAATVFALLTFALVTRLAARRGTSTDRLVLVGIGVQAAAAALTTLVVVISSPWDTGLALTWLSGSTYGRSLAQVLPAALILLVALPVSLARARTLDLVSLDEDVPRVLGVALDRTRYGFLALAALLTAAAACAVGALGFVGLVAPHAARALVGARHARSLPVAAMLGGLLVVVADTLGRTVLAPTQVAAGLVTAMLGAPYFVWLLRRAR